MIKDIGVKDDELDTVKMNPFTLEYIDEQLQKETPAAWMLSESISTPGLLNESRVRLSTIATASFSTDSPKTIENRSTFTPSAWKTASTVTGSVAEISEPKVSAARPLSG